MEPWAAAKKLYDSVMVPSGPVWVPRQRPLAPSATSVANDKGDNEMILEIVHIFPGISFTAEENPRKLQLRDQSSPQMGSLSSK